MLLNNGRVTVPIKIIPLGTVMNVMACRYDQLALLITGLNKINIPFMGHDGQKFIPCGISDDLGMFYMIPKIVSLFNISLDVALNLFFAILIGIPFVLGVLCFCALYQSYLSRFCATAGLILIMQAAWQAGDVYIAYASSVMASVPLILYFNTSQNLRFYKLFAALLLGLFFGFLHAIRSFSCVPSLFFIAVITIGSRWPSSKKMILWLLLSIGVMIIPFYFSLLFKSYEDFVLNNQISTQKIGNKHIFWHSVYIGLGLLNNDLSICYSDECGANKAISIDPTAQYPSIRYEQVMKQEVIRLCKEKTRFIIRTIFAKIGIILYYLCIYGFIFALLIAFFYPKHWCIELAFLIAILVSSLFGVVVMPFFSYLLSLISFSILYAVISINCALEHYFFIQKRKPTVQRVR